MNLSNPLARTPFFNGDAKVRFIFLISKLFRKNFSIFIFQRQSSKELPAFTATRFSNGSAKVRLFSLLPNFSATIFNSF